MEADDRKDLEKNKRADHIKEVQSDATSHETLDDLEQNEVDVEPGSSKRDPGPSPDGRLDESDELKDAGPM